MFGVDIDVLVAPHEAHQEPALALAAILAAPHLADQMVGQVIEIFFAAARDDVDEPAMDSRFLAEFADRGLFGVLARVDPALRPLPRLARRIAPLADEDAAGAVREHHAGAGANGQAGVGGPSDALLNNA